MVLCSNLIVYQKQVCSFLQVFIACQIIVFFFYLYLTLQDSVAEPSADLQARPQDVQALIREATLILKEPLETMAGPLRTYRKRIQVGLMDG